MKAEERHEARENDVAGWLQYGLWNWVREYGSYVLLLAALCFLGYRLWILHEQKEETAHQEAFNRLREAAKSNNGPDPKLLGDLITNSEYKEVKAEAAIELGTYYLDTVFQPALLKSIGSTREDALRQASDNFQVALDTMPDDLLIANKAHLGLAASYEDQGLWDKAKAEYDILADPKGKFADTAISKNADEMIKTLPQRQAAPRLVARMPEDKPAVPAPSPNPLFPGMPGSKSPFDINAPLPSLIGSPPTVPGSRPAATGPMPLGPFLGPSIPGIALPEAPASAAAGPLTPAPATAPR